MKLYKARVDYGMLLVVAPDALRALQIIQDKIGDWLYVPLEDLEEIPLDVESFHSYIE